MAADVSHLCYVEPRVAIDVSFWIELRRRKLCEWQLRETAVYVRGFVRDVYSCSSDDGDTLHAQRSDDGDALVVHLRADSLASDDAQHGADAAIARASGAPTTRDVCVPVLLCDVRTREALAQCDMHALAQRCLASRLLVPLLGATDDAADGRDDADAPHDMRSRRNDDDSATATTRGCATRVHARAWSCAPYLLCVLATYVDVKAYRFHYRLATPALALRGGVTVQRCDVGLRSDDDDSAAATWLATPRAVAAAVHAHAARRQRQRHERDGDDAAAARAPLDLYVVVDTSSRRNNGSDSDDDVTASLRRCGDEVGMSAARADAVMGGGDGDDESDVRLLDYDAATVAALWCARPRRRFALALVDGVCASSASHVRSWAVRNALSCLRLAVPSLTTLTLYVLRGGRGEASVRLQCRMDALDAAHVREALRPLLLLSSSSCTDTPAGATATRYGDATTPTRQDEHDGGGSADAATATATAPPLLRCVGTRARRAAAVVDLADALDPARRADADARMNLELMRWRMLPTLDLRPLARCRALLLGMGTLGCHVARALLAWGVRTLTLVDRGTVAYSNMARQTLYTVADAHARRAKADAAADALRAIVPSVDVRSEVLTLHMPGHRIDDADATAAEREMARTIALVTSHDVVFLLTDTREARWLPTLVAAAHGVPVLNAALGFDTYVVMRHGVCAPTVVAAARDADVSPSRLVPLPATTAAAETTATQQQPSQQLSSSPQAHEHGVRVRRTTRPREAAATAACDLGCYFCSDVVGPRDSTRDRTLDQQCTVTRPAVSAMAAALAVELLAQLSQHPRGFACPAYTRASATHVDDDDNDDKSDDEDSSDNSDSDDDDRGRRATSCLGVIPQQIRGSVYAHTMTQLRAARSPHCTACSPRLLAAYADGGTAFLRRCVNDPHVIEHVCGIAALRRQWADANMASAEWWE